MNLKETLSNHKNILTAVFSALVIILLFLRFHQLSPFIYQTNDDLFFKTIASGEVTGTPESHLYYIGYPAGLIIASLYRIFPALPWYGLFLCFSFGLTMFLVLYKLLQIVKNPALKILTTAIFILVSYSFLFLHISQLQFTAVTGMVGAGAVFLLALADTTASLPQTLKNNLGFLILSAYSFSIRDKGYLMLLPFIGMIFAGKFLDYKPVSTASDCADQAKSRKNTLRIRLFTLTPARKNLFILAGILIVIVGALFGMERLAYSSPDWRSFTTYTSASETIYDYAGYPDYETYSAIYKDLGLTRSSYEAAAHHYNILLDPQINEKTMTTLEKIAEENIGVTDLGVMAKLKDMTAFFIDRHLSYTDRPLNLLVYCGYLLFFILALIGRKWTAVRNLGFLFIARMAVWFYLVYYGRLPSRVSQSVYFAELLLLLAIAFGAKLWENRKILWTFSICLIVFLCFRFGIPKTHAAVSESNSRLNFSQSFVEIKEYFAQHPDSFYYLDMNSFGSFTEEALEGGVNEYGNYLVMGSWLPNSPWYDAKFRTEGITDIGAALVDDSKSVYAVFMKTDITSWEYLNDFYQENYPGAHLEVIEEVSTSGEITFEILKGSVENHE